MPIALVTGSRGFIGQNLLRALNSRSFEVYELNDEYFETENWTSSLISELESSQPDVVFHVGACSNTLEQNVQFMMTRNYESSKLIADWTTSNAIPLIYSSSAANYGSEGFYPSNLYGWSKYAAENYVVKCEGIALRYFNVFGPGEEDKDKMASFIYQAICKRNNGDAVKLFPGKPMRDFVYVDDVVSANLYALDNFTNLKKSCYEVSTGIASSFEQLLKIVNIEFEYEDESAIPTGYQFYTCGDPKKWMPGWKPRFSVETGILNYLKQLNSAAMGFGV